MSRNIALDLLKLLMAFMVIGLHADFLGDITELGMYLTVNGLFRIAVPVFLLINGFFFASTVAKNKQLDWLKRVLVLYAAWMLFYIYFWLSDVTLDFAGVLYLLQTLIFGYHHLWYVSGMIGAALILLALRTQSLTVLIISIVVSFLGGVGIQYAGNYHVFAGTNTDTFFNHYASHRNMFLFSYPFFCLGYLLKTHKIHEKISFTQATTGAAIGTGLLCIESALNFYHPQREGGFDNYFTLIIACPFIFLAFIKSHIAGHSKSIALYSSAIFFIHSLFMSIFTKFTELEATILTLVVAVGSTLSATIIVRVNQRLQFIL